MSQGCAPLSFKVGILYVIFLNTSKFIEMSVCSKGFSRHPLTKQLSHRFAAGVQGKGRNVDASHSEHRNGPVGIQAVQCRNVQPCPSALMIQPTYATYRTKRYSASGSFTPPRLLTTKF